MYACSLLHRVLLAVALLVASGLNAADAQSAADKFYRAYFLEQEKGDVPAAAKLYAEVAGAKDAGAELQKTAQVRLVACREELAAGDLARLMPPGPLAYIELNRPGERARKLLDQLGLLARPDAPPPKAGEPRLAISPVLVDALLGLQGVAVAITGFDPASERPAGVAVLHPGEMEVVRGLLETGLPAGAEVVAPIGGFATYEIEGLYITLTNRLVVAGSSPEGIQDVLERMSDPKAESLASDPELAEYLKDRRGELLFFCVNPKPLMPMMDGLMAAGASQGREAAVAAALLDPKSLRALTGRLELGEEGLALELTLRLAEGHRNLVYNFLRRPAIDKDTLRSVPAGAAALLALSMNEAPAAYTEPKPAAGDRPPIVTALDIGREIFANINGIAVYALPPASGPGGAIPDLAAAISVNDPAKSAALWQQMLGIASLATGAPTLEGETTQVAGTPARSYRFNSHVSVLTATVGHHLLLASSESGLARTLEARRSGKSILDDPEFASLLSRLGPSTTVALLAHAGRCATLARPHLPPDELQQIDPVIAVLDKTCAAVTIDHSDRVLRISAAVSGVPNVGPLVSRMLAEQRQRDRSGRELTRAIQAKKWPEALAVADRVLAQQPGDAGALRQKFDVLAVHVRDADQACAVADALAQALWDSAEGLNNLAWALLTEEKYGAAYAELALRLSERSNELTQHSNWAYVDTLALAAFETGDAARAVELERKAIAMSRKAGGAGLADLEQALERFETGKPEVAAGVN